MDTDMRSYVDRDGETWHEDDDEEPGDRIARALKILQKMNAAIKKQLGLPEC